MAIEHEPIADLTPEEIEAHTGTQLPEKQAMSVVPLIDTGSLLDGGPLLNLNLDLDLDADIAAPIDAAIAANANVALPIDAAVSANVLSGSAVSLASADQDSMLSQRLLGDAIATADQDVELDQSRDEVEPPPPVVDDEPPATTGALLDLNADLDLNLDLAAPIDAAIAANANVGAPIDAAVSANVLSGGAQAVATAPQDSIIVQELVGSAIANADQDAIIDQSDFEGPVAVAGGAAETFTETSAPVEAAPAEADAAVAETAVAEPTVTDTAVAEPTVTDTALAEPVAAESSAPVGAETTDASTTPETSTGS